MAGNVRFESSSASPEELAFSGNYPNGPRSNYSLSRLDRPGSFREGGETRMFSSGNSLSHGSASTAGDLPLPSQWLVLDPITIGDQKYTRSGELRRALGISFGSNAEDNSFGAAHSKPPPPAATEELKRFKASIVDDFNKSRSRKKKFDECLYKLNKFSEALSSVKQQRNEMLTNERSGGSNLMKMVNQIQRNSQDLSTHRPEDRTKNVLKRVRSSVAETRAEGRTSNLLRQPLVMGNDRDMVRDGGEGSDQVEGKIRRLPAGGEGWERKMKRKRSAGTVSIRPIDGDAEPKRHYKLNSETVLQSCDALNFRSGASNGSSSIIKADVNSLPPGSSSCAILKNEPEKSSISRDTTTGLNRERLVAKGNNKLNIREDSNIVSPSPVTKAKALRAPRTGPVMAAHSLSNFHRALGAANEDWEQSPIVNKVQSLGGVNNRKRPTPISTGSSSPPMAQWAGQRPQKISRTRRANLVSPVSNLDEVQMSSEGCSPSDFGRTSCIGTNGPPLVKGLVNGNQLFRVKHEKVSSPAKLSDSEESGAGENHERFKGKVIGGCEVEKPVTSVQNACTVLLAKKNKMLNKEELGDGVRRQGRSGRGSSCGRASFPPTREKLENPSSIKPPKSSRPGPDKNGSKSGRPLKKLLDRKGFTRLGQMPSGSPLDSGESDDDREELLAAANFASNASYLACSGPFWKKMEPIFTNVSLDDACYLRQQVGDLVDEEICLSQYLVSEGREKCEIDQSGSESPFNVDYFDAKHGRLDSEPENKIAPLYQRVLSALIVEDEIEDFEDDSGGKSMPFQYDNDLRYEDKIEFGHEAMLGLHTQKQSIINKGSCNGSSIFSRVNRTQNRLYEDDLIRGDQSYFSSENVSLPKVHGNGVDVPPSFDHQYEHMCLEEKLLLELQSIGLSPETVPDLADGEDDGINKDIAELQKGLHQQIGKRKAHVNKIIKAIEEGKAMEGRVLEKAGLDRLVEVAYRKLLATRGSSAAKAGVPKVPKQVALAFMKRTLARCRKFEITGKSCFIEPALRDVLYAAPHHNDDTEPKNHIGSTASSKDPRPERHCSQQEPVASGFNVNKAGWSLPRNDHDFAKTGPILNRGKKKELLLDDVGGNTSLRATPTLGSVLMGGTKGKRSERERDHAAKSGRPVGERKTKPKPKQKTVQLSTSGNGFITKFTHEVATNGRNKKRESEELFKEVKEPVELQLHELDSIEELGGPQDLSSWLNLDDDGLQDHDSMGLDIPMDDLSDLQMLI